MFNIGDKVKYIGNNEAFRLQWLDAGGGYTGTVMKLSSNLGRPWVRVRLPNGGTYSYPVEQLELVTAFYFPMEPEFDLDEIELGNKLVDGGDHGPQI